MTVNETEAEVLREAANRVLAGNSLGSICRDFAARGITTGEGKAWVATSLRRTLRRPRVAGLRQHQDEIIGEAQWPAIIDRATWEQLCALLDAPERRRRAPSMRQALLTGVAVCGRCGATMVFGRVNSGRWSTEAYICGSSKRQRGCALSIKAEPVEAKVIKYLLDVTDTSKLTVTGAPTSVATDIIALEARAVALAEMFGNGDISPEQFSTASKVIKVKLTKKRAQLTESAAGNVAEAYLTKPGLLRKVWPDLDTDAQRTIISALMFVTITPLAKRGSNVFDDSRIQLAWRK